MNCWVHNFCMQLNMSVCIHASSLSRKGSYVTCIFTKLQQMCSDIARSLERVERDEKLQHRVKQCHLLYTKKFHSPFNISAYGLSFDSCLKFSKLMQKETHPVWIELILWMNDQVDFLHCGWLSQTWYESSWFCDQLSQTWYKSS